jgi:hypothetical protein
MNDKNDSNKQHQEIDQAAYRRDLAKALLSEFMLILHGQEKLHGKIFVDALIGTYLASFVSTLTYNILAFYEENSELSKEERKKFAEEDLKRFKEMIAESISRGLETGTTAAQPSVFPEYNTTIECLDFIDMTRRQRNT